MSFYTIKIISNKAASKTRNTCYKLKAVLNSKKFQFAGKADFGYIPIVNLSYLLMFLRMVGFIHCLLLTKEVSLLNKFLLTDVGSEWGVLRFSTDILF